MRCVHTHNARGHPRDTPGRHAEGGVVARGDAAVAVEADDEVEVVAARSCVRGEGRDRALHQSLQRRELEEAAQWLLYRPQDTLMDVCVARELVVVRVLEPCPVARAKHVRRLDQRPARHCSQVHGLLHLARLHVEQHVGVGATIWTDGCLLQVSEK